MAEQTGNLDAAALLTRKEVGQRYKVSGQTVWRWWKAGTIPAPLIIGGTAARWPLQMLLDWEKAGCPKSEVAAKPRVKRPRKAKGRK